MKQLLFFFLTIVSGQSVAQNLLRQDLYFKNMNYINAAVGVEDTNFKHDIQLYGIHKIVPQNGWNYAPQILLNYIGQIDRIKGSVNAGYSFDNHSFFNRHVAHIGYATHLRKGNHFFDIGARINFNMDQIRNPSVLESESVQQIGKTSFTPDLDLGVQYRIKGWNLGLSVKNLFQMQVISVYELFANERVFYANFGYSHRFGEKLKLSIFTLPSYTTSFQIDLGIDVSLWNRISTSYVFRLKELRHIYSIRGAITKQIYVGASCGNSHVASDLNINALIGVRF